jgi:hypothetical protein
LRRTLADVRPLVRLLVLAILISPAAWFVGVTDAYLAHHLYSADTPRAAYTGYGAAATWSAFNVPLPPEQRLYEQFFRLTCRPGEELTITDTRWWFRVRGLAQRRLVCPGAG